MTDPIADMLARIRNATQSRHPRVDMRHLLGPVLRPVDVNAIAARCRDDRAPEHEVVERAQCVRAVAEAAADDRRRGSVHRVREPGQPAAGERARTPWRLARA